MVFTRPAPTLGAWKDVAGQGQQRVKHHRLLIRSVGEDHGVAQSQELCFPKLVPEARTMTEYGSGHGAIGGFNTFLFSAVQNTGFPSEIPTLENLWSALKETVWSSFGCEFHFSVKSSSILSLWGKKDLLCVCWNNCIIPVKSLEIGFSFFHLSVNLSGPVSCWMTEVFCLNFHSLISFVSFLPSKADVEKHCYFILVIFFNIRGWAK